MKDIIELQKLFDEISMKTHQALLSLQTMREMSNKILEAVKIDPDDEFLRSDLNYLRLKGAVEGNVRPFHSNFGSQVNVIVTGYYRIMEDLKIVMEELGAGCFTKFKEPSPRQVKREQHGSESGKLKNGENSDREECSLSDGLPEHNPV